MNVNASNLIKRLFAGRSALGGGVASAKIGGVFKIECFGSDGKLKWVETNHNLWTAEGRDYVLGIAFKNSTRATSAYVGLNATATPVSTWTMANQGSTWNEFTTYSQAARVTYVDGAISASHRIDNSGSVAAFTVSAAGTVFGAFLSTNDNKGGVTGALLCSSNFTASRAVVNGDTINVTYTVGLDDDGA